MSKRLRTPVLYVHHRSELGGAPASLSYLIRELDDEQFEPHIYCPPGPAADNRLFFARFVRLLRAALRAFVRFSIFASSSGDASC